MYDLCYIMNFTVNDALPSEQCNKTYKLIGNDSLQTALLGKISNHVCTVIGYLYLMHVCNNSVMAGASMYYHYQFNSGLL